MLESKVSVWKEKKSYVSSAQRWWSKESEEMRGVVYAMTSRGPRTESWGTPQKKV